jgi:hypothetical protein
VMPAVSLLPIERISVNFRPSRYGGQPASENAPSGREASSHKSCRLYMAFPLRSRTGYHYDPVERYCDDKSEVSVMPAMHGSPTSRERTTIGVRSKSI